jgi:hypothetical protein
MENTVGPCVVIGKKVSAVEGGSLGTSVNGLSGLFPVVIPNGIAQSRASIATFILRCLACSAACLPAALCTIQFWRRTRSRGKGLPGLARAPFCRLFSPAQGANFIKFYLQQAVLIFSLMAYLEGAPRDYRLALQRWHVDP